MKPLESRRLSLLLCLLLACDPTPDPLSNEDVRVKNPPVPRVSASRTDPLVTPSWEQVASLLQGRARHTTTVLPDGKVLVVGGDFDGTALESAEVYDPTTGSWSFTGWLAHARTDHTASLLPDGKVLVVGGTSGDSALASAEVYDPKTGAWSPTGALKQARSGHTASMSNGKLLVVGGNEGASELASAEVYDPKTGVWSSTGALAHARSHHTASPLPSGKVLVVGGMQDNEALDSAEVYDPKTGAWSPTGALKQARAHHTTTPLRDGRLVAVGGQDHGGGAALASVEEYDPATGLWTSTGSLTQARDHHSATLLPDGRVLVAGGFDREYYENVGSTEVYDPAARTWSPAGSLYPGGLDLTATLLPDGKVLLVGGSYWYVPYFNSSDSVWVYSAADGTWSSAGSVSDAATNNTLTLLPDGRVLTVGGHAAVGPYVLYSAELYDPVSGTWSLTGSPKQPRDLHTATLLPNGKVLVVGGSSRTTLFASAELYDPASATWSYTGSLKQARLGHTATLLPNGKVLVTGGNSGSARLASAELYDPVSGTWSFTGSLKQTRVFHTAILLPEGKVLVLGGQEDPLAPTSAEVYDPLTGKWTSAGSLLRARDAFTATLLPDGRVLVVGGKDASGTVLASAELYDPRDPATGSRATGSLSMGRLSHTATALPGGKVLVVGGNAGGMSFASAEVYDPVLGRWSLTGELAQARENHSALLLPGGKVLVVNGTTHGGSGAPSAELYPGSEDATRSPLITGVSALSLEQGFSITVTGERFRGGSEAGSGTTRSSAAPPPLLSLSSVESGWWVPLFGHDFSDTSVSATLPYVPDGYYLLNVTTQGRTSSRVISIINRTPPDTALDSVAPAPVTQLTTAAFSFSSEPGVSFECSLDGATFIGCTSPMNYSGQLEGEHLFRVRALDPDHHVDPTPAEYRWTVDRTKPDTVIDETWAPRAFTRLASAHFVFSSEEGATFQCSLDEAAYSACSNPWDSASLTEGAHTFQVKATDRAGNEDPTAAVYRWTVDTQPPRRPELQVPTPHQRFFTARPILSGTAEPGSTVKLFVDGVQIDERLANEGGYWESTSPSLTWGNHTATATATDPAGNTSEPSLEVSFATVQRGYYSMSCAAAPSLSSSWPWALLVLGLSRRRRSL
ncbi:kelch repeat-containing protein [Cystobacter fuscus]|uniref:kelch repeat-containing protein n=1 Tax=Cystobacter fuscus TaxID=43 RepID=UPI0037C12477